MMGPAASRAAGYVRIGAMYLSQKSGNEGSTPSEVTRTLTDFGGGAVSDQGWTLGLLYSTENVSPDGLSRVSYGPTVGWITRKEDGPYILGTYLLSSKYTGYDTGTGYQIDLGLKMTFSKISLAPQISIKHYSYPASGGGAKFVQDYVDPYFVLFFEF